MRLFTLILACFTLSLQAATPAIVQQLITQYVPDAHVGVYVQRADTGEVLININGKHHFTPASTIKLFTSYAALKTLGPNFQFNTQLYLDRSAIQHGVYRDPIYLVFSGDPTFSSAHLAEFVNTIKAAGITQITGPVIIDISHVPAPYYARGWTQDDLDWYYGAPVSAAIIDENKIHLELTTSPAPNQPLSARVTNNPPVGLSTYLVSATEQDAAQTCQLNTSVGHDNHITLYGCWPIAPADSAPVGLDIAIPNPTQRIAQLLQTMLHAEQITFTGEVKEGKLPNTATLLAEHRSSPASELIIPILRDSHNLYAEALTKQMGQLEYQRATFQAGSHAIEGVAYESLGLPPKAIELFDGSGVSIYNVATPAALAALLKDTYNDPTLRPLMMNALAVSGKAGTLQHRLVDQGLTGQFIGKTGSLSHVSNLAGYLFKSPDETPLIVILMINNTSVENTTLKEFETALMKKLSG